MTAVTPSEGRAEIAALHYLETAEKTRAIPAGQLAFALICFGLACAFPLAAEALDQGFYIGFATRIMVYVIAVTSLNLLVGYAGLVSFGHAAFFGIGAYAIGALTLVNAKAQQQWLTDAWFAWPFAMFAGALLAAVVGALALRTRQVYFIMVTLAFSQLVYYLFSGMKTFGSDNGMSLPLRSPVGFGLDLAKDSTFYYVVLLLTTLTLALLACIVRSRFGIVIRGISENESRMSAIGIPVFRYKLTCFILAGGFAGLAGALLANQSNYISPRIFDWTQSGTLLMMLILGGVGYRCGGVYGTVLLLVLEEALASHTEYWQFFVGVGIIFIVLLGNNGVASLFERMRPRKTRLARSSL